MDTLELACASWWKLNSERTQTKNFTYQEFIDKAKQYTLEKDFSLFNTEITCKNKLKLYKEKFIVKDMKCVIDDIKFKKMVEISKKIKSKYPPILTLHGTTSTNNINSIVKHGYIMPYDLHPDTGYTLGMSHGNVYGDGIYTTQDFETAWWFSFNDESKSLYLLINLVFLGDADYVYEYNDGLTVPIDEVYYGDTKNYHTKIMPNVNKILSASPKYVFPIYICELESVTNYNKIKLYFQTNRNELYQLFDSTVKRIDKAPCIAMHKIVNDLYSIKLDKKLIETRHHLVVPLSTKQNVKLQGYIKNFTNNLFGDKFIYFYEGKVNQHKINDGESYINHLNKYSYHHKTVSINNAIDTVLDKVTKTNEIKNVDIIYLFIDKDIDEDFCNLINKYKNYTKVKRIILKLIGVNRDVNKYMILRRNLVSEHIWENFTHIITDDNMDIVFDKLNSENNNISGQYKLDLLEKYIGEGFVENITDIPVHATTAYNNIIYKGRQPILILIDGKIYNVDIIDTINIESATSSIVPLLARFRNYAIDNKIRIRRYQPIITVLCSSIIKLVNNQITKLGKTNDRKVINNLSALKRFSSKINAILAEITSISNIKFSGKWFTMVNKMKHKRGIIKRVKENIDISFMESSVIEGYGIRCIRTEASKVEPWLLIIDHVSNDNYKINYVYTCNEFNKKIKDKSKEEITDIVPNKLLKSYYAYLFTRNPYLYISSQSVALIGITFVKLAEEFFLSNNKDIKDLEKIFECMDRVKKLRSIHSIEQILENDNFEEFLTEKYDVASVSIILCLLCFDDSKQLFNSPKYSRFAFALMAETIMRMCRSHIRITNKNSYYIIRKILGLEMNENVNSYKLDTVRSCARTNRILKRKYTNTSPYAVVAVLELVERYHKNMSIDKILDEFKNNVSMHNFLDKHLNYKINSDKSRETQLALFLQGLRYHKANVRNDIRFDDPIKIIKDIKDEQINLIKNYLRLQAHMSDKRQRRKLLLLERAQEYAIYHNAPKIFTHGEIADLNLKRIKDDKLELTESGLLKHHCCYPDCPYYLKNFKLETDVYGKRRGLFKHLQYDQNILNNYVPSFHLMANHICKKKISYVQFKNEMDNKFINSAWYANNAKREENLIQTWKQYMNN